MTSHQPRPSKSWHIGEGIDPNSLWLSFCPGFGMFASFDEFQTSATISYNSLLQRLVTHFELQNTLILLLKLTCPLAKAFFCNMSSYRPVEDRSGPGDTYRPLPAQARGDRNGRMYEEQNSRPHSKDQSRRSTPSPRRYTPPHGKPYNGKMHSQIVHLLTLALKRSLQDITTWRGEKPE